MSQSCILWIFHWKFFQYFLCQW